MSLIDELLSETKKSLCKLMEVDFKDQSTSTEKISKRGRLDRVRKAIEDGNSEEFFNIVYGIDDSYHPALISLQERCAILGRREELNHLIRLNKDEAPINIISLAAQNGHMDIVNDMLDKIEQEDRNEMLRVALDSGYTNIIDALIAGMEEDYDIICVNKGVIHNYELARYGNLDQSTISVKELIHLAHLAAKDGNEELVNKLIDNDKVYKFSPHSFSWVMCGAIKGCHLNIVDAMIKLGAEGIDYHLIFAVRIGNISIVKRMMESCKNVISSVASYSIEYGHLDILRLVINEINPDEYLELAAEEGHREIVEYLLEERVNRVKRENELMREELCKKHPIE